MPLFFVVGGFACLTAWRSLVRRGGTGAEYVRNRVLRLAQPALPLYVFYVVVLVVILLIGVDPKLVDTTVGGAGAPLWFLAAYTLCQAVVPLMVRLHARAPRATLLVLLAGVIPWMRCASRPGSPRSACSTCSSSGCSCSSSASGTRTAGSTGGAGGSCC